MDELYILFCCVQERPVDLNRCHDDGKRQRTRQVMGAQDGHIDFHPVPVLWYVSALSRLYTWWSTDNTSVFTCARVAKPVQPGKPMRHTVIQSIELFAHTLLLQQAHGITRLHIYMRRSAYGSHITITTGTQVYSTIYVNALSRQPLTGVSKKVKMSVKMRNCTAPYVYAVQRCQDAAGKTCRRQSLWRRRQETTNCCDTAQSRKTRCGLTFLASSLPSFCVGDNSPFLNPLFNEWFNNECTQISLFFIFFSATLASSKVFSCTVKTFWLPL